MDYIYYIYIYVCLSEMFYLYYNIYKLFSSEMQVCTVGAVVTCLMLFLPNLETFILKHHF